MLTTGKHAALERGVTLIEIAIGLVIIAMTLMFGLPSMADWIHNLQIRNAAEAVQNGLQTARGEAVRRNANVEFVLSNPGVAGGTGWTVRIVRTGVAVQTKPNGEGSASAKLAVLPAGANTITFNGLGRTPTSPATNNDGTPFMTQIDVDSSVMSAADSRELRLVIGSGGQIRMCDPSVSEPTDPRSC